MLLLLEIFVIYKNVFNIFLFKFKNKLYLCISLLSKLWLWLSISTHTDLPHSYKFRHILEVEDHYSLTISNWALKRSYQRRDLVVSVAKSCVRQVLCSKLYTHMRYSVVNCNTLSILKCRLHRGVNAIIKYGSKFNFTRTCFYIRSLSINEFTVRFSYLAHVHSSSNPYLPHRVRFT